MPLGEHTGTPGMVDDMKIGFIGLGNMGAGMAANLLKAGHDLTAYNRSPDKVAALAEQGATPAKTVAEACGGDVVISMLANDEAVEAVTSGDDGIRRGPELHHCPGVRPPRSSRGRKAFRCRDG